MCAPNAPARPRGSSSFFGGAPAAATYPNQLGPAVANPAASGSAAGGAPPNSYAKDITGETVVDTGVGPPGAPGATRPTPAAGATRPTPGATPAYNSVRPPEFGGAAPGVTPNASTPIVPSSGPVSVGVSSPGSSTTSLTAAGNDWSNQFAHDHPEFQGQSISPFEHGATFGPNGEYNGPIYDGWTRSRGYDPNGFTGIKDNVFQVGGVGQIGMLHGWRGGLDFGDNTDNALQALRSQLRVGIPTLPAGWTPAASPNPAAPPPPPPPPAPSGPPPAPGPAPGPVNTDPWGNPKAAGPTTVDPRLMDVPPSGTPFLPRELGGNTPSPVLPPSGSWGDPSPSPLYTDSLTPLAPSGAPRSYMPLTSAASPRSAVAQALARRFNPQLWA